MGPLRSAGAALTGAAGALLTERLCAAAADLGAGQSGLGAVAEICKMVANNGVHGRDARLNTENGIGELDFADLCACHVKHFYGRHCSSSSFH